MHPDIKSRVSALRHVSQRVGNARRTASDGKNGTRSVTPAFGWKPETGLSRRRARRNEIGGSYAAKRLHSADVHKSALSTSRFYRLSWFVANRGYFPSSLTLARARAPSVPCHFFSLSFSIKPRRRIHLFDGTIDHRTITRIEKERERAKERRDARIYIATLDMRAFLVFINRY